MDSHQYRQVLGSFLTGVTVVTTLNEQSEPIGFTANSFTSVSLDPPLILVCLAKSSFLSRCFKNTPYFAINILAENQRDISTVFSSPVRDRFAGIGLLESLTGSPIIEGATAWLDCAMHEIVDGGDHLIFIGRVIECSQQESPPLGYLRGNYLNVSLEQDVTRALENPVVETRVGVLVEHDGRILLLQQEDTLILPAAATLGNEHKTDSLKGLLAEMDIVTSDTYLFAVYETQQGNTMNIIYRAHALHPPAKHFSKFYPFAEIPFEKIPDASTRSMLERYVKERAQDTFGIYVGDEDQGNIKMLKGAEL